jgi:thiamine kinase-like enzyme
MANRMTGLDIEHTELVLKNIARFHALSFAMYGGSQKKIMELYPWLEEKMFPPLEKVQDQMKMWFSEAMKNEAIIIRKEGFDKEALLVEQICDNDGKFFVYMNDMLSGGMKNAVISHGDCWTNNMLFSYDQDNKLKGIKFLDFQLSRCAPRCIDLAYFLHSSIPIPNLNTKEEDFLRIYLDEFKRFLKILGTEPEDYDLTWEDFMEEYMECKFYGVAMGLMLAPMLSAESKDVPDMESKIYFVTLCHHLVNFVYSFKRIRLD